MRHALFVSSAWCALSCSSPQLRGGESAPAGLEPAGKPIASFRVGDCRDVSGGKWERSGRVLVLADPEDGELLVAQTPGYDSVVTRNGYLERGERVFQVIVEDAHRKPLLLDYRVPRSGDGRMAAARWYVESETEEGAPRGRIVRIDYACRLVAETDAPEANPQP